MRSLSRRLLMAACVALACGEGTPFSATVEAVSGNYHATTLTAIQPTGTVNLLLGGGSLLLNLAADGTTSGRLFVPGAGENGEDVDVDLTGTWTLTDNIVTFDQPNSDTFIRDMPFTAEPNRLRGEEAFGDVTIRVVLTK